MKRPALWKLILIVGLVALSLGGLQMFTSFDLLGATEPTPVPTPDLHATAVVQAWNRTEAVEPEATATPLPTQTPTPEPTCFALLP